MKHLRQFVRRIIKRGLPIVGKCALILVLVACLAGVNVEKNPRSLKNEITIGFGQAVLASGTADFSFNGDAAHDTAEMQDALDALPLTGGRLNILNVADITFNTFITRAIPNVQIIGVGQSVYFALDGVNPVFIQGGDNWTYRDFRTDAGGINTGAYTYTYEGISIGSTYYAYKTSSSASSWNIPTGRSATYIVAASNAPAHVKAQADEVSSGTLQTDIATGVALGYRSFVLTEGSFVATAPILYPQYNFSLRGQGRSTLITLANNSNCYVLDAEQVVADNWGVRISDLRIDANKANQTSGGCIAIKKCQSFYVERCDLGYGKDYDLFCSIANSGFITKNITHSSDGAGIYIEGVGVSTSGLVSILDNISAQNVGSGIVVEGSCSDVVVNLNQVWLNGIYGIYVHSASGTGVVGNLLDGNSQHGIFVLVSDTTTVASNTVYNNSYNFHNTYDGICIQDSQYCGCMANISQYTDGANHQRFGINLAGNTDYANVIGNNIMNNVAGLEKGTGTHNIINNNTGYIIGGEVRTSSGSLTAGVADAISFAWHNPELQDILIKKVVIEVTTAGGTGGSLLQVGIADDATGTNLGTEFFPAAGIPLNTPAIYDSWNATDTGVQTKFVLCQDSASATDGWIVGKILTQNATALVGKFYVEYVGR